MLTLNEITGTHIYKGANHYLLIPKVVIVVRCGKTKTRIKSNDDVFKIRLFGKQLYLRESPTFQCSLYIAGI